ncbi:MAG: VWA domain-containing protein [Candidatus Krumholzibacteriota bacterium]
MYTLAYPWLLSLILLPPLLRLVLPSYREPRQAIRAPWFQRLATLLDAKPADGAVVARTSWYRLIFQWLLWALLVLALARPQFIEPPISRVNPTRDLLLLVDLSGSMDAEDFTNAGGEKVDRLTAVKEVLDEFLTRREGDRVGLIVFGSAAFVQVPFTQDLDACRMLLEETAVRMAGPKTAFGDAIGLGITLFERSEVENRVMIALTDGNDTGSRIPPAEAARIARDNGIQIHVIGVGDPAATGEEVLDEEALAAVARVTDGRYFFAQDRDELAGIYDELDRLDTREIDAETYRPRLDRFHWPLGVFLVLGLLQHTALFLLQARRTRRAAHG